MYIKSGCGAVVTTRIFAFPDGARRYTECETWQQRTFRAIDGEQPDAVLLASASNVWIPTSDSDPTDLPTGPARSQRWAAGMRAAIDRYHGVTPVVAWLGDPTVSTAAAMTCDAADPSCGTTAQVGVALGHATEVAVARAERIPLFDPTPMLCRDGWCPAWQDGYRVHRNGGHLSYQWAGHSQQVADFFAAALHDVTSEPLGRDVRADRSTGRRDGLGAKPAGDPRPGDVDGIDAAMVLPRHDLDRGVEPAGLEQRRESLGLRHRDEGVGAAVQQQDRRPGPVLALSAHHVGSPSRHRCGSSACGIPNRVTAMSAAHPRRTPRPCRPARRCGPAARRTTIRTGSRTGRPEPRDGRPPSGPRRRRVMPAARRPPPRPPTTGSHRRHRPPAAETTRRWRRCRR